MDQNIDLLKSESHNATGRFLDAILSLKLWPLITRPARITQKSATLIDNIYISTNLQRSFNSLILIDNISDHPMVALLKQTKLSDKTPIEYTSRKLNDAKIKSINNKLCQKDWNGILNSEDVNANFDVLCSEIEETMEAEAPLQTVKISGNRGFQEPWLTTGIETASCKNHALYRKTLRSDCTLDDLQIYKHRNILNHLHCTTRITYYNTKCREYSTNTKKLWKLINQTIGECKASGSIILKSRKEFSGNYYTRNK